MLYQTTLTVIDGNFKKEFSHTFKTMKKLNDYKRNFRNAIPKSATIQTNTTICK